MKGKVCPYCGRRISYFKTFHNKKKGIYNCARCKKECKIKTDFRLIAAFAAVVLTAIIIVILWVNSDGYNTPWGIFAVAALFIIFYFCTPFFIKYVPLKKNLQREEDIPSETFEPSVSDDYVFNRDVFDQIKNNRNAARKLNNEKREKENERVVPVIKDVSEAHASSDAPLKKVNKSAADRIVEEIIEENKATEEEEDIKTYTPKPKKPDGSRYTANRKF